MQGENERYSNISSTESMAENMAVKIEEYV